MSKKTTVAMKRFGASLNRLRDDNDRLIGALFDFREYDDGYNKKLNPEDMEKIKEFEFHLEEIDRLIQVAKHIWCYSGYIEIFFDEEE